MTLNQFTLFAAVAKHLNVRKASEELRVSQPSISQQLKQLEIHYGTKLYRRLSKGVEITEAGQLFLRDIAPILEQVAKLEKDFKPASIRAPREILKVGGSLSTSSELLPALLARFRLSNPAVELELRTRTSDDLERMVLAAEIDLAATVRIPRSAGLACEPLRRERVAMFVLAHHSLARKAKINLSELLAEPLIIRGGRGASGVVDKAMQQIRDLRREIKVAMYCDGPTAIKAAVRQKMGVGMVYEDALKSEVASGEFKILHVEGLELEGESFIIYSKTRPLSPLAQKFLELLRATRTSQLAESRSKGLNRSIALFRSSSDRSVPSVPIVPPLRAVPTVQNPSQYRQVHKLRVERKLP